MLVALWKLIGYEVQTPIPRMTYYDAMDRFGTDKPDLRFGLELVDCTDFFKDTPFRVFQAPYVGAVVMPGGASQPRRTLDGWQEFAKQRGHRGLAYVLVGDDGELGGPVAKNLSDDERAGIVEHVGAAPGDCVFFAAGGGNSARGLLGATRLEIGRRNGLIDESQWSFVWVVDAPLFEPSSDAVGGRRRRCRLRGVDGGAPRVHLARSPSSSTRSTPIRDRRWRMRTTSSATATRSAAGRSVSTAATSRSACSR